MKSFWLSFLVGFVILFSFQNCQKSPASDELSSVVAVSGGELNTSAKLNLSDRKINEVHFASRGTQTVTRSGKSFSIVMNVSYEVLMPSGQILLENEQTGVQQNLCLNDSLKEELNSILATASICINENKSVQGKLCAQVVVPAYAKIVTDKEIFELGASTDSCGSGAADLCGDSATLLKGFISHLKTQINNLTCP